METIAAALSLYLFFFKSSVAEGCIYGRLFSPMFLLLKQGELEAAAFYYRLCLSLPVLQM